MKIKKKTIKSLKKRFIIKKKIKYLKSNNYHLLINKKKKINNITFCKKNYFNKIKNKI
ncbi:putative ribosomal protein L35 [Candidatus Carsonella ruddii CS isolate Thao2000]|uniref:Putative ribosomal protein L35 n=1 Tax=Candidatus Carsonella ruddii CS isolate Thao2000 TaxID=1202537 RepID=J7GWE9_CARRU|nr:hypothetical protein [Candidatus Carsonella ruddii]AFP83766.1 putative ribosomal protein L35 [Candidatus Carsonella ruddii CS isolate Thao2000]